MADESTRRQQEFEEKKENELINMKADAVSSDLPQSVDSVPHIVIEMLSSSNSITGINTERESTDRSTA